MVKLTVSCVEEELVLRGPSQLLKSTKKYWWRKRKEEPKKWSRCLRYSYWGLTLRLSTAWLDFSFHLPYHYPCTLIFCRTFFLHVSALLRPPVYSSKIDENNYFECSSLWICPKKLFLLKSLFDVKPNPSKSDIQFIRASKTKLMSSFLCSIFWFFFRKYSF